MAGILTESILQGYNYYNNSSVSQAKKVYVGGGGTERLTIDLSTGNVGIGTTAPGEKLDVQGGGIKVGNFKIRPISGTELGLYDFGGNLILIFDQGI
jgi:hypothetical protein